MSANDEIEKRGYETRKRRYQRLVRDVLFATGALSSAAGIYVLAIHLLDGEFGKIGLALWDFLSKFSDLWYDVTTRLLDFQLTQLQRNLVSLYFIFGATAARAWQIFSLERPIEYRLKGNRIYWGIEDEFVSETVCDSEIRVPKTLSILLVFIWPILLPYLYWYHDGRGNTYFEDIYDENEYDGKSDWRIYVFRTRASYRKFFVYQILATMFIGLFVLSADALF